MHPNNTNDDRQAGLDQAKRERRRYRRRPRVLPIGTISSGTLRLEDLIPALAGELSQLRLTRDERRTVREAENWPPCDADASDDEQDTRAEDSAELYDELCTIADAHVPDYCYFGSLEGDGAEIGVWPQIPDGFRVNTLTEGAQCFRSNMTPGEYRAAMRDGEANGVFYGPSQRDDLRYAWRRYVEEDRARGTGPATHWLYVNDHGNATLYRKAGRRWVEVWSVV